jgi:hypothetical protein
MRAKASRAGCIVRDRAPTRADNPRGLRLVSLDGMNVSEVVIGHGEAGSSSLGRLESRPTPPDTCPFCRIPCRSASTRARSAAARRLLKLRDGLLRVSGAIVGQRPIQQQILAGGWSVAAFWYSSTASRRRRLKFDEGQLEARPQYFAGDFETVSFQISIALPHSRFLWYVSAPSTTRTSASAPIRTFREAFQRRRNSRR